MKRKRKRKRSKGQKGRFGRNPIEGRLPLQISTYEMAATSARFLVFRDLRRLLRKTALVEVTAVFSSLKVMLRRMSGQRIRSMVWTGQETIFFLWLSAEASNTSNKMSGPPASRLWDWHSDTNSVGWALIQFQIALCNTMASVASVPFLKLWGGGKCEPPCAGNVQRRDQ